ncbi:uncharacterized protein LOC106661221 [Cimex lectularius]|uniref:Uncharacterized protein n=1 Tax=Cimex lectularius TaxID=79782 RepID=A0A8I6R6P4_CIMLE|nr:uncharacterized protein LOC106661221 [Cimex lectularius]
MAVPFNVPEEEAEERRVIRIPICEFIRQFIQPEISNLQPENPRPEGPVILVLPEAVLRARKAPAAPRRRRRRQEKHPQEMPQQHTLSLGIELRHVEEHTYQSVGQTKKRRRESKTSSFFSLLLPTPLPGSIWTTVIILVGWRILTRQRKRKLSCRMEHGHD